MASRIWLHIGTEKTGTTTIQAFLAKNRDALARRGMVVPVSPGKQNHLALTGYAQNNATIDDVRISHGVRTVDDVPPYRARVEQELYAELAEVRGQIVLSNEHLSSRLRTRDEISRLKTLLNRLADHVTVVVYVRNQVDFLASWYSTSVKAGNTARLRLPLLRTVAEMLDYGKLLDDWAAVFGAEHIVARRFVAKDFADGDLLADFAAAIGVERTGLAPAQRHNASLDCAGLSFLRDFNRHVPRIENGRLNPLRKPIVAVMEGISTGPAYRLPADVAEQIAHDYAAINAAVSLAYFEGRHQPLFPPAAPAQEGGSDTPDAASYARIAAELWKANVTSLRALEQQLRVVQQGRGSAIDQGGPA